MVYWWMGGQINKIIRPIAIPLTIVSVYGIWHNHPWYCVLPALLYGFILTIGYGEGSKLMKLLKSDELVRDFYSALCAVPVFITCVLTQKWFSMFGCVGVVIAFQLREGSWGKIGKYDILPDDLFRGLALGLAVSWALL